MRFLDKITWNVTYLLLKIKHKGFYSSRDSYATSNCKFSNNVRLYGKTRLSNVKVGSHTYFAGTSSGDTTIGKYCCVGPNTIIGGLGTHPTNYISIHPIFYSIFKQSGKSFVDKHFFCEHKETKIGNDVWIGVNSIILDGVKIGNGAIIAAGSVVTKDIPDYAIVGGIPAKIIKYRYPPNEIKILNEISWWDLDEECLKELAPLIRENNILQFQEYVIKYNRKTND